MQSLKCLKRQGVCSCEVGILEVPNLKEKIETLCPVGQPSVDPFEEEEG